MKNQIHRPRINRIGPTQAEPKLVRMYFKAGNASMLLARLDHVAAIVLEHKIRKFLKQNNSKLEGTIIQTQ